MNDQSAIVVFTCVAVLFAIGSIVWHFSRAATLLGRWAASNGFRVLEQERLLFFRGPFFWTTGKGQEVYRVTVEDTEGRVRRGHVRCGGYFLGMLSDNVEVRWDEPRREGPGFPVVLPGDQLGRQR